MNVNGLIWLQFSPTANLVLQDTIERIYAGKLYADIPRGIFIVRGENVLLLGEIVRRFLLCFCFSLVPADNNRGISPQNKQDLDREDEVPSNVQQAPFPEVFELKKKEDMERKKGDTTRHRNLQKHGFEGEHSGEILF